MASHGDTPHWQIVQECSAGRANHGRVRSEEVALVEFMFLSDLEAVASSSVSCKSYRFNSNNNEVTFVHFYAKLWQ